ncbi:hypothetical protein [Phycicoccus avicenniae]|uniref:hypothetical protein n=1 Tax=Phycicoccus avicenniae TaxID=2828860 RepID=UPI003D2BA7F6
MRDELDVWFTTLLAEHEDRGRALDSAYQSLENAGVLNRVVVHRYICARRGCKLATVIRVGGRLIARTGGYKLAPGTNLSSSVESARLKNTLDGERHWFGRTFDVLDLVEWEGAAGLPMNCRCRLRVVSAVDIVEEVGDTQQGHPGAPSLI